MSVYLWLPFLFLTTLYVLEEICKSFEKRFLKRRWDKRRDRRIVRLGSWF